MIIPLGYGRADLSLAQGDGRADRGECRRLVTTAGLAPEDRHVWTLARGDGLHRLQWLTSNVMHAGIGHLAGTMIFLWGLGVVVEGKLGWLRFLPAYLGLAIVQSALIQAFAPISYFCSRPL